MPLFRTPSSWSPGFGRVSSPVRLLAVVLLGVAGLAGGGVRAFAEPTLVFNPPVFDSAPPAPAMDDLDVSPYLAYYKARSAARAAARFQIETANQDLYDARYYSLDLHLAPPSQVLTGTVTMRATVVSGPLSSLELDLNSTTMTVDAALANGSPTTYAHAANLLTVALDRAYATGETVEIVIQYSALRRPPVLDRSRSRPTAVCRWCGA